MIELLTLMLLPLLGAINSQNFPDVLSSDEETKYLEAWRNKDFEARNKLIEHNLRLVAHIVKKFENTGIDKDDLLSIGTFGLIKAIDTFNFDATNKLATYAARCIENEILMHIRSNKKRKDTLSLYSPIGEDKEGNEIRLCDIIEDPTPSISDIIIEEERNKRIHKALKILNKEIPNVRKVLPRLHIVGYDCISTRINGFTDLTSIDFDYDEICHTAVKFLLNRFENIKLEQQKIVFTVKLHQRKYI
mgnify:CR=1 FL=1